MSINTRQAPINETTKILLRISPVIGKLKKKLLIRIARRGISMNAAKLDAFRVAAKAFSFSPERDHAGRCKDPTRVIRWP